MMDGEIITERGICLSASIISNLSRTQNFPLPALPVFFSVAMTGLSASTTYHMRGYATNSSGAGYSDDISFTTPAAGTFPGIGVGDGTILYHGYFYVASEMPDANGNIHILKVNAADFSDYIDYIDFDVTIGGRSILAAGGYLWTVEEQGGTGSKLYRRSLTTLVSDANYTPMDSNPTGFKFISAMVSDGTYIYCFGQMSLGSYFAKVKISDGAITTHTAYGSGYSSLGWVHAAVIDTTPEVLYIAVVFKMMAPGQFLKSKYPTWQL